MTLQNVVVLFVLAILFLAYLPAEKSSSVSVPEAGTTSTHAPLAATASVQNVGTLPWLHSAGGRLETPDGSYYPLRGVDVNGLIQYGPDWNESIPLTAADFEEMHALGLTFVRLSLSWSLLEPAPGVFNQSYLNSLSQVVSWARAAGIYILVDMHQDLYNRFLAPNGTEQDGFPTWATFAGNASRTCPVYLNSTTCLEDPAVDAAWNAFWNDTSVPGYAGLQESYAGAWQELAATFANSSTVAGYDLMNEPATGDVTSSLSSGFCPNGTWEWEYQWEDCFLLPFYQSLIHAIRQVDDRHAIFFEPSVYTDALNWAPWNPVALGDPNLVYEPHVYTNVFGPSANWSGNASALLSAYQNAQYNAQEFGGVAWFVGEYGTNPDDWHDGWIEANVNLANEFDVGSSFWEWKDGINATTVTEPGGSWGVVNLNGTLRSATDRAQILASPHPVGAGGGVQVGSAMFNFTTSNETLNVTSLAAGGWVHLYLPSFWYPSGYVVSGNYTGLAYVNSTYVLPGGTALDVSILNATCSRAGNFTVHVSPEAAAEGWLAGNVSPAFSNVTVAGLPVTTDRGNFTLAVLPGTVTVAAAASGYLSQSVSVVVTKGTTTFVHLALVQQPPPSQYPVTFTESGLAPGSSWSVTVNGTRVSSPNATAILTEQNGTYTFAVTPPTGYTPSPSAGTLIVAGKAITQTVVFNRTSARATYAVTFTERGLPQGTPWSVTLNGSTQRLPTTAITFQEINGSDSFTVGPVSGYTVIPSTGIVKVNGSSAGQSITFTSTMSKGKTTPTTGLMGLPGNDGYVIFGIVAAVIAGAVVLYVRKRSAQASMPSPTTEGHGNGEPTNDGDLGEGASSGPGEIE